MRYRLYGILGYPSVLAIAPLSRAKKTLQHTRAHIYIQKRDYLLQREKHSRRTSPHYGYWPPAALTSRVTWKTFWNLSQPYFLLNVAFRFNMNHSALHLRQVFLAHHSSFITAIKWKSRVINKHCICKIAHDWMKFKLGYKFFHQI